MSRWFRHYAGMMRDDKLVRVAIRSGQTIERVVWVWGAILESAAELDDGGNYEVDAPEIAYFLRANEADVVAVLAGLEAIGRIRDSAVVKWGDRQFSSDRSAERQKRYRDKKREDVAGSDNHDVGDSAPPSHPASVTSPSRHGDAPETELETETKREKRAAIASCLQVAFVLPDDIPREPWEAFERMRKKMRKPMSDDARHLAVARLRKLRDEDGWPPGDTLNHCTMNSYQGIYPPPKDRKHERSDNPLGDAVSRILRTG